MGEMLLAGFDTIGEGCFKTGSRMSKGISSAFPQREVKRRSKVSRPGWGIEREVGSNE